MCEHEQRLNRAWALIAFHKEMAHNGTLSSMDNPWIQGKLDFQCLVVSTSPQHSQDRSGSSAIFADWNNGIEAPRA
jgi:hypothetical protein